MRAGRLVLDAAAATVVVWSAVRASRTTVSRTEEQVFRRVNDGPEWVAPLIWPVMQMGSLGAVFVAAGSECKRSGPERAVRIAVAGTAVWGGIKLIKPLVGRGRPADHLDGVSVRGRPPGGLGYPSGHAAVSMVLALLAHGPPVERALAAAAAGSTGIARLYVGAHLPLDVVGGAAVGWIVGSGSRAAIERAVSAA